MVADNKCLQGQIDHTKQMIAVGTVLGQIWIAFSILCGYLAHKGGAHPVSVIVIAIASYIFSFGFVYHRWLRVHFWYLFAIKPRQHFTFFQRLTGLFSFLENCNGPYRLVRCYNIGQQWVEGSRYHAEEKKLERRQAKILKLAFYSAERRKRYYHRLLAEIANGLKFTIHQLDGNIEYLTGEHLEQLFNRYQHASPAHRKLIERSYNDRLEPSIYNPKSLPVMPLEQSSKTGQLLYLAALIRAQSDYHYDRLDFQRSDFAADRYVYSSERRGIKIDYWQKHLPSINAYLGGEWGIEPLDGRSLVLFKLHDLPSLIPFTDNYLRKDQIFYGYNVRTGDPYYNALETLPHHLVVGQSGSGKSVFLKQTLASIAHNIEAFEKVYLVDLKGGVELAPYASLHDKFQLVDDYEALPAITAEIYKILRQRLSEMREQGDTLYQGKHILVIVDEFAQITQFEPITADEKQSHKQLLSNLNRISQIGRAAKVTIWAQLQKATIDNISATLRNNLQSKICFRVHSNSDAATVFGNTEDLPGISSVGGFQKLAKGRFIFSDDVSGETVYLQATMMDDEF